MAKISSSSLLGNLQSQSTKTLGFLKQSDVRTDSNVKKASMMNASLDATENEVLDEEAKISSVGLLGEEPGVGTQDNTRAQYLQGFSDAMTTLTKQLKSEKKMQEEEMQTPQQQGPQGPGGVVGGALAGGALAAGGFAALSGTSGTVAYGGKEGAALSTAYSPFKSSQPIISGKGFRRGTGTNHQGYDVSAPQGTPVHAYFPGFVTRASYDSGYGYYIEWKDNVYGQTHFYAHLMKPASYSVGQKFDQGAVLGYVGSTGRSDGPHLHWEIGGQGSTVDPGQWTKSHPMKTKETEAAKVKPEVSKPITTQLQPPPRPQVQPSAGAAAAPQTISVPQRVSSSQAPTYSGGSNNSLTASAAFLQALS